MDMKRIFFVILMTVFCANVSFAQVAETVQNQEAAEALTAEDSNINKIVPFMKYRTLKNIYNYKDYVKSDIAKHSVGGCGVASFFIPGLGQMICNEVGRGFAWLDTGSHDNLLEAANFVATFQKRQGMYVSCIEEIAFRRGFINREQLLKLADPLLKTAYGQYLVDVANGL